MSGYGVEVPPMSGAPQRLWKKSVHFFPVVSVPPMLWNKQAYDHVTYKLRIFPAQKHFYTFLFTTMPKKNVPKEAESAAKADKNRPKSKHEKREEQKAHKQKVHMFVGVFAYVWIFDGNTSTPFGYCRRTRKELKWWNSAQLPEQCF